MNLNFEFARRIGFKAYEPLNKLYSVDMRIGEWLFAREAWGAEFGPDSGAFAALCREGLGIRKGPRYSAEWMDRVRSRIVPEFLDEMCSRICGSAEPAAVGFSCMFFQTVPSLALARRIKNTQPKIKTIFGGACLHTEMGEELISKAPWIDIVSTGEADGVICGLARCVLENRPPEGLEGVLYRDTDGRVRGGPPATPTPRPAFESLPVPDYDEFMADAASYAREEPAFKTDQLFLPFESSRGCWWGEKKQCAFCGLNAENMAYRSRSAEKTLEHLTVLADRYPVRRFFATDNNMPPGYYREFLPKAAECASLRGSIFFYEIKTNVDREKVQALARGGVTVIQPGIETLSTPILQCMRKGATAIDNIHLLKLCRIFGITPMWNLLIRVPGERLEDYEQMMRLIPGIVHLHPPTGRARMVQLHRYSPYFREHGEFVDKVRAQEWYAGLFPADRIDLMKAAYYFDAEWKNTVGSEYRHYGRFVNLVETWVSVWCTSRSLPKLSYDAPQTGTLDLMDTRFGKNGAWRLDEEEAAIYRLIDEPAREDEIRKEAENLGIGEERVRTALRDFVHNGLAVEESGVCLGLAIPETVASIPLKTRRDIFRRFG